MSTEASKTRAVWGKEIFELLRGEGIDIGCGVDPILPNIDRFDQQDGDANQITKYIHKKYDFVFSSHTLEHMKNPHSALKEWFSLVKPGGHLIVLVPDEDLYEQGCFPSIFNSDHQFTFTISKLKSWSPRSINILDLVQSIPGELVNLALQDNGIDRNLIHYQPRKFSQKMGKIAHRIYKKIPKFEKMIIRIFGNLGAVIDQTDLQEPRLAQIQFIIRKRVDR